MKIAVYGASGFVGGLVAAEARRRGAEVVLIGRHEGRLRAAAAELGSQDVEVRVAALDDPVALAAALDRVDAVVNCATPFTLHGGPVVEAALTARVHYVDVAGEELYIKTVLERYGDAAARAGVTVLPAANNDCLTGDLLGHLAADGMGELSTISVAFTAADTEGSRGTVQMALVTQETMRSGGLTWQDGDYVDGAAARRSAVDWPGDAASSPVVRFALPPAVTIPRHVRTRHAEGLASPEIHGFFGSADQAMVDAMPLRQGPGADSRARSRYTLVVDAVSVEGQARRAVLQGRDVYGTTGVIAVEAVRRLVEDGARSGALTPAEAFDGSDFLDFLRPYGVTWTVRDVAAA